MEKLKLMHVVCNRNKIDKVIKILKNNQSNFQYIMYGKGGASEEICSRIGGMCGNDKSIVVGVIQEDVVNKVFESLIKKLKIGVAGSGVLFTTSINDLIGTYTYRFLANDLGVAKMEEENKSKSNIKLEKGYDLIYVIVNADYSELAIETSREAGAKGATIINAKGSGSPEANLLLGISIKPEKEVVMILVENEIKEEVMKKIAEKVGLSSEGQGIIFSQKVDYAYGLVKTKDGI